MWKSSSRIEVAKTKKGKNAMFDRQTKKFCAAVLEALPEVPKDIMQGWIENPCGLNRVLREALCLQTISYIVQTFTVMVDETLEVMDAIAEGKFDWVNENITNRNFPKPKDCIRSTRDMALFHFGKNMSSEDAIARMVAEGYRPATIWELLAFARDNPDLQRRFPIVALGSGAVIDGLHRVAFLYRDGSRRLFRLSWIDDGWGDHCRFLAVRK